MTSKTLLDAVLEKLQRYADYLQKQLENKKMSGCIINGTQPQPDQTDRAQYNNHRIQTTGEDYLKE
jgi:hypothetical protein